MKQLQRTQIVGVRPTARPLQSKKRFRRLGELAARDGWCCWYCGADLDASSATVDEWIPRGKGGRPHLGNQVLACSPCNHDKGDLTGSQYIAVRAGRAPGTYSHVVTESDRVTRDLLKRNGLTTSLAEIWPGEAPKEGDG